MELTNEAAWKEQEHKLELGDAFEQVLHTSQAKRAEPGPNISRVFISKLQLKNTIKALQSCRLLVKLHLWTTFRGYRIKKKSLKVLKAGRQNTKYPLKAEKGSYQRSAQLSTSSLKKGRSTYLYTAGKEAGESRAARLAAGPRDDAGIGSDKQLSPACLR